MSTRDRDRDQFLLDAYEEKLAIARSTLVKAQRETAYWERALEDLKRDQTKKSLEEHRV
jgi:hypothetical protein